MTRSASMAARNWRVAKLAAALGALGLAVDSVFGEPARVSLVQVIAIPVCASLWAWASLVRRSPSVTRGTITFLLINAVIIIALTASAKSSAESGIPWVPFRANHLGAVTIALLAPPTLWVGVVAITAMIGAAVMQYMTFAPAVRAHLAYGDPWSTMIYGGFAMALLFYRRRGDVLEREAARMQAEADDYHRFGLLVLAVRDLANTPLQTLTNLTALLRAREVLPHDVDAMERAVTRLRELGMAMKPFGSATPNHDEWDPKAVLGISGDSPG